MPSPPAAHAGRSALASPRGSRERPPGFGPDVEFREDPADVVLDGLLGRCKRALICLLAKPSAMSLRTSASRAESSVMSGLPPLRLRRRRRPPATRGSTYDWPSATVFTARTSSAGAFAASTSLSDTTGKNFNPQGTEVVDVVRALLEQTVPVDIDTSKERWAVLLRQWHPGEFSKGGHRIVVPMISNGELLGLLSRWATGSGALPFRCRISICSNASAIKRRPACSTSNCPRNLLQAKELEAFQTMSAFFVHDLKNTASTLNLMLQNLPVHFNDPAFREDALRGIAKTVDHINDLIERLSLCARIGNAAEEWT